ncbi:protein GRAVITROPIC IN THE LIGHT 1 [Lolium perenne]|uniref:protein GRAVITROPIC IN THE LIGHT 1 n=1 Tax=Lolium perenne TaxID=4522 RepID=UPI0021EB4862|nr:protein GRAVITROPIC IN THE LIGHT 1 [Lolium perenne]
MASKAVTIGDLIHRVASSCLSNRFPANYAISDASDLDDEDDDPFADFGDAADAQECRRSPDKPAPRPAGAVEEQDEEVRKLKIWEEGEEEKRRNNVSATAVVAVAGEEVKKKERVERAGDAEALMAEVFDAVSGVRRAYAALQGAHCPWDPDRMRAADAGVVAELRHLARLRDRFRRSAASPGGRIPRASAQPLREAVAPYEAELDDLRRQLQGKQAEVDGLKERLATATSRRNARLHPSKKHHHIAAATDGVPTAELFVACAEQARAATRGFAAHLLHLLRAAGLDPAAATRSITKIPVNSSPHLARHALEAHATAVLLGGFEHESFYLDGSLSSLLDPAAFRRERYAQYRDMRGMDPGELLGVLPTCAFGRYAAAKFASLLPPRVEEAVLGGEHRAAGNGAHPRTPFYGEFLRAAKAVWLLHLLAFALEPPPSHFEAGRGAEFHPEYMESVVVAGRGAGAGTAGMVVGFAVAPGFKLCNAAVVRARVYLVPRGSRQ